MPVYPLGFLAAVSRWRSAMPSARRAYLPITLAGDTGRSSGAGSAGGTSVGVGSGWLEARGLDEALAQRVGDHLDAVFQVKLLHDVTQMALDRVDADREGR